MDDQHGFTLDVELRDARRLWGHRDLLSNGPHKGAQLPGDGHDYPIGVCAACAQLSRAFTEPHLRLPTNILDGFGQLFQTPLQVTTDVRWIPVGPGAFDEGTARMGIASFGDRSLAAMVSRGIF